MAIRSTIALIEKAQVKNNQVKTGIVLTMVKNRTSLNSEIKSMLNSIGKPVLNTMISDRVSYTRSALTGGIHKTEDIKAKNEMMGLADEIFTAMGL